MPIGERERRSEEAEDEPSEKLDRRRRHRLERRGMPPVGEERDATEERDVADIRRRRRSERRGMPPMDATGRMGAADAIAGRRRGMPRCRS